MTSGPGSLLSHAAIAALFGVGAFAAVAPVAFARAYGLELGRDDAAGHGFVRALGARDATIGGIALAFTLRRERTAVRVALAVTSVLTVADLAIVATSPARHDVAAVAVATGGILALFGFAAFLD